MSHDEPGYLVHCLGKELYHFMVAAWAHPLCHMVTSQEGYPWTIWIVGWALPVLHYGHGMGMGGAI